VAIVSLASLSKAILDFCRLAVDCGCCINAGIAGKWKWAVLDDERIPIVLAVKWGRSATVTTRAEKSVHGNWV